VNNFYVRIIFLQYRGLPAGSINGRCYLRVRSLPTFRISMVPLTGDIQLSRNIPHGVAILQRAIRASYNVYFPLFQFELILNLTTFVQAFCIVVRSYPASPKHYCRRDSAHRSCYSCTSLTVLTLSNVNTCLVLIATFMTSGCLRLASSMGNLRS
jgi:hypothetical protein